MTESQAELIAEIAGMSYNTASFWGCRSPRRTGVSALAVDGPAKAVDPRFPRRPEWQRWSVQER
jgi:hypothetical protein